MNKDEKKEEDELYEEPKRWLRPRVLVPLVLLLILAGGAAFYVIQTRNKGFTRADLADSYEVIESTTAQYASFGGGFLRWSTDGISFLGRDGREKWNASYSMNQPKLVMQGDYGAVADLSGRRVIVFSKDSGLCGLYNTAADILGAAVSGKGLTAVALDEGLTSKVQFFEASGNRLDIELSFEMSLSGYPLAMTLSPDGTGLVISFVSANTGALSSQIAFYNFAVGKSEPDRLMGFFKYEEQLLPRVDYLGASRVVAVGDAGIEFFSLAQENKPELIKSVATPNRISVYQAANGHVGIYYADPTTGKLTLSIYDSDGELCFSKETEGSLISFRLEAPGVLALSDTGLTLWNYAGKLRYSGSLSRTGQIMFMSDSRTIMQFDGRHIYRYRLK